MECVSLHQDDLLFAELQWHFKIILSAYLKLALLIMCLSPLQDCVFWKSRDCTSIILCPQQGMAVESVFLLLTMACCSHWD